MLAGGNDPVIFMGTSEPTIPVEVTENLVQNTPQVQDEGFSWGTVGIWIIIIFSIVLIYFVGRKIISKL